jgi:predicted membrane metal-binding protein
MTAAIAWAWVLKNWKLVLAGMLACLIVGAWAYVTHLHHIAKAAKAQTQAAVRQAQIQTVATRAVDQVAIKTQAVEEHTRVVVKTIQAAPGSDAPVPADVLRAWRDGLSDDADPPH